MSNADFTTRMQGAIDKIKKAATDVDNKNVKIVLTGYCVPTKPECDGSTDLDVPIAAMKEKKFDRLAFRKLHPAGNLGAQLKTVEDLMLKGKNIPFVNENLKMKDALKILTRKK